MFVIQAMLWVAPGQDNEFADYEEFALGLFREHGGEVLSRFRPFEGPTEIHVLRCPSREAFDAFRADPRLAARSELRSRIILKTELILGEEVQPRG